MTSLTTLRYSECDIDDKMKESMVLECVPDLSEELREMTKTSSTIYCLYQLMTELQPEPRVCICCGSGGDGDDEGGGRGGGGEVEEGGGGGRGGQQQENMIKMIMSAIDV